MKRLLAAVTLTLCLTAFAAAQTGTAPQSATTPAEASKPKMKPPKAISSPDPDSSFYDEAKRTVVFRVEIGTDGLVHNPTVVQSSGSVAADDKAQAAIKQWKFKPATRDGVPVPVLINVEIRVRPQ
jgi:TonB family protein